MKNKQEQTLDSIIKNYLFEIAGYETNIKIYNDLIKVIPEICYIDIDYKKIIYINEWLNFVNIAIKIKNRNTKIDNILL